MTDRTDKELLIAAAKAAGYTVHGFVGDRFVVNFDDGTRGEWSPLTDDGDALRLAVKLNISIKQSYAHVHASMSTDDVRNVIHESVAHEDYRQAATRLAIVRRAAASLAAAQGEK